MVNYILHSKQRAEIEKVVRMALQRLESVHFILWLQEAIQFPDGRRLELVRFLAARKPENASAPIFVKPSGNWMAGRFVQP
jgi:hypothetical protein